MGNGDEQKWMTMKDMAHKPIVSNNISMNTGLGINMSNAIQGAQQYSSQALGLR